MQDNRKKKLVTAGVSLLVVSAIAGTCVVIASTASGGNNKAVAATVVHTQPDSSQALTGATTATHIIPSTDPDIKPYIIPEALRGLKVTKIGADTVSLSWDKSANVTAYKIYRAEENENGLGGVEFYKLVTANSFTDSVQPAVCYRYVVEPVRSVLGYDSKNDSAEIALMTKPEAIKNLHVFNADKKDNKKNKAKKTDKDNKKNKSDKTKTNKTTNKADTITIKWKKNSKATSYTVYRARENEGGRIGAFKKITTVTKARFKDTKLSAGTVYQYKVEANRSSGKLFSTSDPETVEALTGMKKPTGFTTAKTTLNSIKIKWDKASGAQRYELRRNKKKIATVTGRSYTDKKLKHSTIYNYSVRAVRDYDGKTYKSKWTKMSASTNVKVPYVKGGLSGTWVQVNIATQTLKMYVDNKPYVTTPVVTGNVGDRATTKGFHRVISRKSPAILKGSYGSSRWETKVNYWLGFTYSGQGIHDSTWRSSYGGGIYKYNGSHGCVNTPLSAVAKVYAKSYYGMPVVVY